MPSLRSLGRALLARTIDRSRRRPGAAVTDPGPTAPPAPPAAGPAPYPGDYVGEPDLRWAPVDDGAPDPGEVVWTWVPFEEDHRRGKDRPVLLVGRDGDWLLGLPLTSKDHDLDEHQERASGREWVDIGAGGWDSRGRPSEARVNRVVRVDPTRVRRSGVALDERRFAEVAAAVRAYHSR